MKAFSWWRLVATAIAGIASVTGMPAWADRDPSACRDLLRPDQVSLSTDSRLTIAYFDSLTEHRYKELKESGEFGALIPIKGVAVDVTGSFQKMRTSLEEAKKVTKYNLNQEESIRYASSRLPAKSVEGFVTCMRNRGKGLYLYPANPLVDSGDYLLMVEWNPPSGLNEAIDVKFGFTNGSARDVPLKLSPAGKRTFFLTRKNPNAPLLAIVNGSVQDGQYTDTFVDPPQPPKYSTPSTQPASPWDSRMEVNSWAWLEPALNKCGPLDSSGIEAEVKNTSGHPNYTYAITLRCRQDGSSTKWAIITNPSGTPAGDHKYLGIVHGYGGSTTFVAIRR